MVGHFASRDFSKRHEAIMEGEKAAVEALPKIQAIVKNLKQEGRLK
jgi:NTE family protein